MYDEAGDCEGFDPFEHGCPGHEMETEETVIAEDVTTLEHSNEGRMEKINKNF